MDMFDRTGGDAADHDRDLICTASTDRRRSQRHVAVLRVGKIILSNRQELCLIRNISTGGLMAEVYSPVAAGEDVEIELKTGSIVAGRVVWAREKRIGIRFHTDVDIFNLLGANNGDQRPRLPRLAKQCMGRLRIGSSYFRVEVLDISQGGAKIGPIATAMAGDSAVLIVDDMSPINCVVRWTRDEYVGLTFNNPVPFPLLARWAATRR